jgi:hypothetical protein
LPTSCVGRFVEHDDVPSSVQEFVETAVRR